ncbi:MAG: exodeoxyribonuclease VII large subunit [Candidatus Nanohaloarchaea archaeon]
MKLDEKTEIKLAAALAAVGIALMLASSKYMEPEKTRIGEIDRTMTGQKVQLQGTVKKSTYTDKHTFLTLKDGKNSITVAAFNTQKQFPENVSVTVEGEVKLYKGRLEVIADEIKRKD